MENRILKLYKAKTTVFTAKEIGLIWGEDNSDQLKSSLKYYSDKDNLIRLRRGIYAKPDYDVREAAVKIYTPAYISFETALRNEGVIFQYYETIFVASYLNREIKLKNGQNIQYYKIKNEVLLNMEGIDRKDGYFIADKEIAFLDTVYRNSQYYFDNLRGIDWKKCFAMVKIYRNKKMEKELREYYNEYKDQ
jgi:hypothetical protein